MFKKFMKSQFNKKETTDDYLRFLCGSPLIDGRKKNLQDIRTKEELKAMDGD